MRAYLDTSALTKRYIREQGSDLIDDLFLELDSVVVNSICLPEIISALSRLRREKSLNANEYNRCKRAAIEDVSLFEVCQLSSEVLRTTIDVLEHSELRAVDALHVACAIESKVSRFVSSDKKQLLTAKKFNLKTHAA